MPVKFFCDNCGIEIFQEMDKRHKETTTIREIEMLCLCSYCLANEIIDEILSEEEE